MLLSIKLTRVLLTMGLILRTGFALAQVEVRLLDGSDDEPVPYVQCTYRTVGETNDQGLLGEASGRIVLPVSAAQLNTGVIIELRSMGFHPLVDTLRTSEARTVRLQRATIGLPEMVVTGQYAPAIANKAVHKVRVLTAEQFDRMAANNLGDALRNELNIRLSQDNILGTSMSMQGLGGQNVKILVDGVPVIGRQDGNIDLAQLDLTGIERAEIIEGPLSVNYGTNALAGTINLITRKRSTLPATLNATVYAEHIGRLNTTLSGTRHWGRNDVAVTAGRNYFNGWDPSQSGVPDLSPTVADSTRFQQWKPREQYFGRLNYRWTGERWSFGYKGEGMHDRIINRGMPRAPYYETAFDEEYVTVRLDNALFAEGRFANGRRLNALAAHDRYQRTRNTWFRDLTTLGEALASIPGMQDTTRFTLTNVRTTCASSPDSARISYETGLDLNYETGAGERIEDGEQSIGDYAAFGSLEYRPVDRLTLRPGVRYAYNTRYGAPLIPSLNVRWQMNEVFTLRASYAQGFRAPSLKELYFYFVDVNHDIVGNEDLEAERSHNVSTGLTYRKEQGHGTWTGEINGFYNAITDLITLAQVSGSQYSYVNIGNYRTAGGSLGAGWDNGRWVLSAGTAVTGRYDEIAMVNDEPYLFTPEVRGSITRQWPEHGWSISAFWKYQGEQANYVQLADDEVARGTIDAYNMADVSISKRFWGQRLALTAGCKDLFDVQNVNTSVTAGSGGAHSGVGGTVPMTTGRTVFMKVELELKKR